MTPCQVVRASLRSQQPIVIFRSATDHVVPGANARRVLARIGSERTELVSCPSSFHVVSLDHDAPIVRERILSFARDLDAARTE
jgi:carboxylesterase